MFIDCKTSKENTNGDIAFKTKRFCRNCKTKGHDVKFCKNGQENIKCLNGNSMLVHFVSFQDV